jgi:hypothetical protein
MSKNEKEINYQKIAFYKAVATKIVVAGVFGCILGAIYVAELLPLAIFLIIVAVIINF